MTALLVAGLTIGTGSGGATEQGRMHRYLTVASYGVSANDARSALEDAGATVVRFNEKVGVSTVRSGNPDFVADVLDSGLFTGVARDRAIGRIVPSFGRALEHPGTLARGAVAAAPRKAALPESGDPFAKHLWGLNMVDANLGGSYSHDLGDRRVLVGIMDTGIEAGHKDLRRNVDRDLSRNFTTDIPEIDGPCEEEKDRSCEDSPLTDPDGHGTAVASLVAGRLNGFGLSGVAPKVKVVNLRVGQEGNFIFTQPVVDALTYAGDNGIDIVNMSFWIDPWFFNCTDNPHDTPEQQMEQQTIIAAVQNAVDYARDHDVTPIAAMGNDFMDLGDPRSPDPFSPTFPLGEPTGEREVDNSCLFLPQETDGVINVSGVGPSGRKSFFSNYGMEQAGVAAPSGDDFTPDLAWPYNSLLVAWSKAGMKKFGLIDKEGKPKFPGIVRRCSKKRCNYYLFNSGTSFSSPIASGVAALIVGRFGDEDGSGGLTMDPNEVEAILKATAEPHACPPGGVQEYPEIGDLLEDFGFSAEDFTAVCEEGPDGTNGFFGHGMVNALNAVTYTP